MAWLATACAMGPKYAPPNVAVPPTFAEAPVGTIDAVGRPSLDRWWTAFRDPMLDDLVRRAIDGNLDLKIAAARVREARAIRGIAASVALPQVDATGSLARGQRSEAVPPFKATVDAGVSPFGPRTQNAFEVGFDAGWEIDVFGGVRRDVEAAVAQVQSAQESQRDVLVTLLGDMARTYAELRGTQRQLEILSGTVRSQRDTLDLAQARFDAGLGTALDAERAEGLLAATTSRQPELERVVRRDIFRLGVLLGKNVTELLTELERPMPVPQSPELPVALPSELLSRRPDLRRVEREVAVATARVGVARADLFPRFSITGSFGRRSEDVVDLGSGTSQFWFLVPGVRWPVLSGGRIRANIRVQDARQEQTVVQYEKAVLTAVEEVENALSAQSRERRRLEFLRTSVGAHRRALDLAMDRYTSGLENFLSVLDAQRTLYAAEDSLAQSETNTVVSMIAVYKALGGGWPVEVDR
jgi:NodT family efflux transporter outer membrane factor (OMF) lipoprotein